jgi:putative aldouronate transport system permease protein
MLHDLESVQIQIQSKRGAGKRKHHFKKDLPFFLMLLPGLVVLLINNYIPMLGVVIAFEKFQFSDNFISSFFTSKWVNFDNFKFLFQSPDVATATRNTILYNLVFIVLDLVIPVALAILLNELTNQKGAKFFQSAAFLPFFMSWMVVAYLALSIFKDDGAMNNLLVSLSMHKVNWYFTNMAWPYILTFFHLWKYTGYNIVIFLATISGISSEYYEAAAMDGATKWQQVRYITLPMLKTVMIIVTLLAVGRIFNSDFGLFYNVPMNQGQLYPVSQTLDTYVYNAMNNLGNISMTTAAGLYQAVCGCITVFLANLLVRKIDKEQALF